MSVQQLMFLASTGGAVLFALVGYVLRGVWAPGATATAGALQPAAGPAPKELGAARQAEVEAKQALRTLAEREKQLNDVQRRYDELLGSVDQSPTQVTEPSAPAASAATLQQLERESATLRQQLEDERKARQQAERQLAAASKSGAPAKGAKGAKGGAAELEKLRKRLRDETEQWNKERNDLRAQADRAKTAQDKAQVQQEELRKHVETLKREQQQLRAKAGGAAGGAKGDEPKQAEQRVRQLEAELKEAEARGKDDQAVLRKQVEQLRQEALTNEKLSKELDKTRDELAQAEAKMRRATETTGGAAAALREENTRLKEEGEALRAKVAESEFKDQDTAASLQGLDKAKSDVRELQRKLHVAEKKAATADALRDEVVQLRASVEEAGKQGAELKELEELRKKQRELQVKSQMLTQRVEQLQHYADENVTLRERVQSLDAIGESHGSLQQRIKDLEAQLFAKRAGDMGNDDDENTEVSVRMRRTTAGVSGTTAATLEGQLKRLSEQNQCRVAVLADSQGLLLSGAGENQYFESLAGIAGMIREMAQKTREFLPLGAPQVVEISDANAVSLYARLLKMDSELFALCTLGQRGAMVDPLVEDVVGALPRVLAGSSPAKS